MYEYLIVFGAFVFLYSVSAGGLARTPVSGPIVFTAFGFLIGPLGLNLVEFSIDAEGLRALAELTLAMVLFTDAAKANTAVLRRRADLPQRLLLIGLPLTIALGFAVGVGLLPDLSAIEVALLATILAPTDAALGAAVVADQRVPQPISQGLNVESGLNDGICVPILFVFLAFVTEGQDQPDVTRLVVGLLLEEIGIGAAVGLAVAYVGAGVLGACVRRGWVTETWRQLPVVALALGGFGLAQLLGGSGFIAAFVGGLLFGVKAREHKEDLLRAAEGTGDTLALITWIVFGAAIVGHTFDQLTWPVLLYAGLSLTLIRMLPVFVALTGVGLGTREKLFIGWFGPRGLASIVFAVIVIGQQPPDSGILRQVVVATIILSIVGHGLTANPLIAALTGKSSARTG